MPPQSPYASVAALTYNSVVALEAAPTPLYRNVEVVMDEMHALEA